MGTPSGTPSEATVEDAIDEDALDAQTGGDAALAHEVLGLFADQCRALLPPLADPTRPAAERADLAHTLKGSAAGVGAVRVRALADAIEAALRAGEGAPGTDTGMAPGLDALTDALAGAVAAALARIARRD